MMTVREDGDEREQIKYNISALSEKRLRQTDILICWMQMMKMNFAE